MFSFRFSSLKKSFHAHTDGPIPSFNDHWPLIEMLSPTNTTTLVSSPVRYVVDTVPARWIVKPTGTGQPTNFSCITPIPPYSIFYFEDPSEVFSQYPGLMIFMDIVDLVKEEMERVAEETCAIEYGRLMHKVRTYAILLLSWAGQKLTCGFHSAWGSADSTETTSRSSGGRS